MYIQGYGVMRELYFIYSSNILECSVYLENTMFTDITKPRFYLYCNIKIHAHRALLPSLYSICVGAFIAWPWCELNFTSVYSGVNLSLQLFIIVYLFCYFYSISNIFIRNPLLLLQYRCPCWHLLWRLFQLPTVFIQRQIIMRWYHFNVYFLFAIIFINAYGYGRYLTVIFF